MSASNLAMPQNIGDVFLNYSPDKLILTPRPRSIVTNAVVNGAFALWFLYRAIVSAMRGEWLWMAICIFFVLFDILLFWYTLMKRGERLVIDKATNRIQGRSDTTAIMVSEVQRILVAKNSVSFIAFEKAVRPSIALLSLRDKAEARWLGQVLAEYIGVPLQVME